MGDADAEGSVVGVYEQDQTDFPILPRSFMVKASSAAVKADGAGQLSLAQTGVSGGYL